MITEGDLVVKSFIEDRVWERHSLQLWENFSSNVKENSYIIDVGAYTGIYALLAASVSSTPIVAFEPMQSNFDRLVENCKINKYTNILTVKAALSNIAGSASLFINNGISHPSGSSLSKSNKTIKTEDINVIKGDDFFNGDEPIALIKIDAERHEPEVLMGLYGRIKQFMPTMIIEALSENEYKNILDVIGKLPYNACQIDEQYKRLVNLEEKSYSRSVGKNLLFTPKVLNSED